MEDYTTQETIFTKKLKEINRELSLADHQFSQYVKEGTGKAIIGGAGLLFGVPGLLVSGAITGSGALDGKQAINPDEAIVDLQIQRVYYTALQEYLYQRGENPTPSLTEANARNQFMTVREADWQRAKGSIGQGEFHFDKQTLAREVARLHNTLLFADKVKGIGALSFIEKSPNPVVGEELLSTIDNFIAGKGVSFEDFYQLYRREKNYSQDGSIGYSAETPTIGVQSSVLETELPIPTDYPEWFLKSTRARDIVPAYIRRDSSTEQTASPPSYDTTQEKVEPWSPASANIPPYLREDGSVSESRVKIGGTPDIPDWIKNSEYSPPAYERRETPLYAVQKEAPKSDQIPEITTRHRRRGKHSQ